MFEVEWVQASRGIAESTSPRVSAFFQCLNSAAVEATTIFVIAKMRGGANVRCRNLLAVSHGIMKIILVDDH